MAWETVGPHRIWKLALTFLFQRQRFFSSFDGASTFFRSVRIPSRDTSEDGGGSAETCKGKSKNKPLSFER